MFFGNLIKPFWKQRPKTREYFEIETLSFPYFEIKTKRKIFRAKNLHYVFRRSERRRTNPNQFSEGRKTEKTIKLIKRKLTRTYLYLCYKPMGQTLGSRLSWPKMSLVNKVFTKWPQSFYKRRFRLISLRLSHLGSLTFWLFHLSLQHHAFLSFRWGFGYTRQK